MKLIVLAFVSVLSVSTCFASAGDDTFAKGVDMAYRATCKNEFPPGASDKDIAELKEAAQGIRTLLKSPKATLKAILEASSRRDLGVFPLIMSCGLIANMPQLSTQGCRDLDGSAIDSTEAIRLCSEVIAKIEKN